MNDKQYNHKILTRISEYFKWILPIGAVVVWVSAIAVFFGGAGHFFVTMDVVIGIVLMIVYAFRRKISVERQVFIVILIPIMIAILTFGEGSFATGTMSLMILSNAVAVLFLSRRQSYILIGLSLIVILGLWMWSSLVEFDLLQVPGVFVWVIQVLLFILVLFVLQLGIHAIKRYLHENILELEEAVDLTYTLAYYDQLTGLPNWNRFEELLTDHINNHKINGYIVILNLKSLNMINSIYGLDTGDRVLSETGRILNKIKDISEIVARVGGNEFLFWTEQDSWTKLDHRLDELKAKFFSEFPRMDAVGQIEYYICYAPLNVSKDTVQSAYHNANTALTYAKNKQQEEIVGYDESFDEGIRRNADLRGRLRRAIDNKTLTIDYQPQIDARSNSTVGVEALARWRTETYGPIGPAEFVPLTEELNLAVPFGQLIVNKAFEDYQALCEKYGAAIRLSINISPSFLRAEGFQAFVAEVSNIHNIDLEYITFEITEDIVIEGLDQVNEVLRPIRHMGTRISLDDFGTGYSSFNYLSRLEVDEIKIDKMLIDQVCDNERSDLLIETIIDLSKKYELDIVAEGIERKEQLACLMAKDCYIIQGYYYARPEPLIPKILEDI